MSAEKLSAAIGEVDLTYVDSAVRYERRLGKRRLARAAAAAAVAAAVFLCAVTLPGNGLTLAGKGLLTAHAIAEPSYPKMAQYSAIHSQKWAASRRQQRDQPEGYADGMEAFYAATMQEFLGGADGGNLIYSPLNIYLCLSMLAEVTAGDSQSQILTLLGTDNTKDLRAKVSALWNASYCDDGIVTSILANSLWLDRNIAYNRETLDILADCYYVSSYQGRMGSAAFDKTLQTWLKRNTGSLLDRQASRICLYPDTLLALASATYFEATWSDKFQKSNTSNDTFHTESGDITCRFMRQRQQGFYFWGENFGAVSRSFQTGGEMWFILPDEDVKTKDLLSDPELLSLLFSSPGLNDKWENQKYLFVNLAVPKFDVSSTLDLTDGLRTLGVTDVFDSALADFSPIIRNAPDNLCLSQTEHTARVTIDEDGVKAAAFTIMLAGAGMPPEEEIDFVLNRPFLFVIKGLNGLPLFVGIVNNP